MAKCTKCGGEGKVLCSECAGEGEIRYGRYHEEHGECYGYELARDILTCQKCYGIGRIKCKNCNGRGYV